MKLGPLPRLLNDISVALRNPQLHMPTNQQPERPKDRLFTRPSFNRLMSSDFQSLMMRDLNRFLQHRGLQFLSIKTFLQVCEQNPSSASVWLFGSINPMQPFVSYLNQEFYETMYNFGPCFQACSSLSTH